MREKNQLKADIMLFYLINGVNIVIQVTYMPVMIWLLGQSGPFPDREERALVRGLMGRKRG